MRRLLLIVVFAFTQQVLAQDPPRFQPGRPPPLDNDFDDPIEEEIEPMDQPNRIMPGLPPPQIGQVPSAPPPTNDFKPSGSGGNSKIQFKIVEGEFFEKGKPRGRTPPGKRSRY